MTSKKSLTPQLDQFSLQTSDPTLNIKEIQKAFEGIKKDPYNKEGYRYRAVSRFNCEGEIRKLEKVNLYQESKFNPITGYGGIERDYPEIPEWFTNSSTFKVLVNSWLELLPVQIETLSVHQIRTVAPGAPVPEGKHRDGNDWVGIFVVNRVNLNPDMGITTIWADDPGCSVIFHGLLETGSLISFDDRITFHDTSEVKALPGKEGYRDVFVFSSPDHKHYIDNR